MRRRTGRKRKLGRRKPSGDLILPRRASPAEVAAAMPHRKGLGKKATDQRAESELGRMVLRGELEEVQGSAGELYRNEWKAYIASLSAPKLAAPPIDGGKSRCADCGVGPTPDFCLCEYRKRRYDEACEALTLTGTTAVVRVVCLYDQPLERSMHWLLHLGLGTLARHYGLTNQKYGVVGNVVPKTLGT